MVSIASRISLLGLVSLLCGCAISPTHPNLRNADLPEMVPLRKFVANIDYSGGYALSPDGTKMLWYAVSGTEIATFVRKVDGGETTVFRVGRNYPFWAYDSRHLIYEHDRTGDENTQIMAIDTEQPNAEPVNLTPWKGSKSNVAHIGNANSSELVFVSNRRNAALFDAYAINLKTRKVELLARNPGDAIHIVMDVDGTLGGRVRKQDGHHILQVMNKPAGTWKSIYKWSQFDTVWPLVVDRAQGHALLVSNIGRDKSALIEFSLADAKERVLSSHPDVDVGNVVMNAGGSKPVSVWFDPGYPQAGVLDAELDAQLRQALPDGVKAWRVQNTDRAGDRVVLKMYADKGTAEALFDRRTHKLSLLVDHRNDPALPALTATQPIQYQASDGMPINGYLTLPKTDKRPLPMLVWVHGGPWARSFWQPSDFNAISQFFANRGYAVLDVNYRGSRGYGRRYMEAAIGELGGRLQQDITDGVQWAIRSGIADPARIAIGGGSFGGYSTLQGLTQQPQQYACGINIVGVADMLKALETFPPYWRPWMDMWHRYAGDPANPEDRERLRAISPLYRADAIKAPLLVIQGANDVRVVQDHSDAIVQALRKQGKPVDYLLFADEGHHIRRWQNRLVMHRKIEDFLAGCLGGRSNGFDFYQLGTWLP